MSTRDPVEGKPERVHAGPLLLAPLDLDAALCYTGEMVAGGEQHYICFCEANLLAQSAKEPRIVEVLNQSDATFADGIAVVALARLHGHRLPGRVSGPSFFIRACEYGVSRGWRHFFYGGGEGVAATLAARMQGRFPGIEIAGTYTPPFRQLSALAEDDEVLRRIEATQPDLLWVGLGGPKQEFWMAEHRYRMRVPVMLGVGAAFDFHTGNRPWAPSLVRRLGLEWAWRTFTGGPATLKRNIRCVSIVTCMLLRACLSRKAVAATAPHDGKR